MSAACQVCGATPGFEECRPLVHTAKAECARIVAVLRGSAENWGPNDVDPENRLVANTLNHLADALEKGDL